MLDDRSRRVLAVAGSAIFFFIAPMTVAGILPWWITRCQNSGALGNSAILRVLGVLLILAGLIVLLDSFARFAMEGLGTPAPVFPTRRLVVRGLYRYVRNPMYVAVIVILLGQALFFENFRLLEYSATVWILFHLFVLAYEEPTLCSRYGDEYRIFCDHVPRWIPRVRPWDDSASKACR